MPSYVIQALCMLLVPLAVQAAPAEVESRLSILKPVTVSEYRGAPEHGLKLTFEKLGPNPALALFSLKDAREVLAAMEPTGSSPDARSSNLERRVREEFEERYGPPLVSPPSSLESARWFQALKLSPRYMGDGAREAAVEMFKSPAMLLSVGMSMMLYMMAWAAPEPVFSKAFAAAVTLGLLMTYTVTELHNVGMACLTLYREAEAAKTREQLEAVAERFGKAMGGVGLRVLVTVAGAQLARGLPEVPGGGLWARLSPPRFAFAGGGARGGLSVGAGARAQVSVANGTVVLMGVSANTTASAVASAVSSARTTGDCAQSKADNNHAHHLCTNKNNKSEITGGPWTPRFEEFFEQAGMSIEDPVNIVYLRGHKGPHPEDYHREVFSRLDSALQACRSQSDCRARLVEALDKIAGSVCTPGSNLNKLVKRSP
ncbi:RhsD protein [Cystobacter fuscus]|uniref:RhsD protein n=1 Tax=Cystobacter fuscus TaxID=43 RepID=A0A250ITP6_9BACT|nr:AHH domain-containing protein [Cystobacter fuscus]ATB35125.1 RhsD protein [Cystobacter fuscus]